jgi:hypothetical protein
MDARQRRLIAIYADYTDEGTVVRYFDGKPVRPSSRARIERALRELGLERLIRVDALDGVSYAAQPLALAGGLRGPR